MTRGARLLWAALAAGGTIAGPAAAPQGLRAPAPPASHERPAFQDLDAAGALRGEDALRRVYDLILDARFEEAEAELRRACGPAPPEACDVLRATAVWWRLQLDPHSRALDEELTTAVSHAVATTEAWTDRAPDDAEAWFYMGGAYGVRVQFRVLRGARLSAARDGKRIRQAMERATQLDPNLHDAYFGLGLYKYYADVAPTTAKILRFLLLLPGGDREEGLRDMLRARANGRILQGEADYQLHIVYLWYEQQTSRALELLHALHARYPGNPLFWAHIAEIQDTYQHDITASLAGWRRLLEAAREHRVNAAEIAEVRARFGTARQLEALHETDAAIVQLEAIVALKPGAPYGSLSLAHLRLGQAHDRLGDRTTALAAYRDAVSSAPALDPHDVRTEAAARIRRAPDATDAEAYRLSLDGWRLFEENHLAEAAATLERSLALNGSDPVTRYRYGRVLVARRLEEAALAQFEAAIRGADGAPAPIVALAYVEAARLHERAARRDDAIAYYRTASTLFGASAETRDLASRALERLTPSR